MSVIPRKKIGQGMNMMCPLSVTCGNNSLAEVDILDFVSLSSFKNIFRSILKGYFLPDEF